MDKNRPQPGRVTSPTLQTKISGSAPIAPRPRTPSMTDETTLPGTTPAPKGVAPRAPSLSRPDPTEVTLDPKAIAKEAAKEAAKELLAPLEARLAELDARLQSLEKLAAAAGAAVRPAPPARAPEPSVVDTVKTVVNAPAFLPSPSPSPNPPPVADIPPPPAALTNPLAAPLAVIPSPVIQAKPASIPPPVPSARPASVPPPHMRASIPSAALIIDDKPLAKHEYSSFDGSKRQRRVTWMFILVLVGLAAALAISFATCQG